MVLEGATLSQSIPSLLSLSYVMGAASFATLFSWFAKRRKLRNKTIVPLSSVLLCPSGLDSLSMSSPLSSSESSFLQSSPSPNSSSTSSAGVYCKIVLLEHVTETNESVMYVHKMLRPIKTRIEHKYVPPVMMLQQHISDTMMTAQHHRSHSNSSGAVSVGPLGCV